MKTEELQQQESENERQSYSRQDEFLKTGKEYFKCKFDFINNCSALRRKIYKEIII